MTIKLKETKWEVESNEHHSGYIDETFDTKKQALEYINGKAMGKHFNLYKTTIKRELIKKINLKRPRPCHGGWYAGHSVSEQDEENQVTRPYCTDCGYRLRLIHRNLENTYITDKPLVHKDDKK